MRPIDADALIERIKYSFRSNERVRIDTVTETFLEEYCSPTLDCKPVRHGRWMHGMQCSYCKQVDTSKPRYCPTCGARMDVKEECE